MYIYIYIPFANSQEQQQQYRDSVALRGPRIDRHYSTIHSVTQSYVTKAFHLQAHCGNRAILIAAARYPLPEGTEPFPSHFLDSRSLFNPRRESPHPPLLPVNLIVVVVGIHARGIQRIRARYSAYYVFHSHARTTVFHSGIAQHPLLFFLPIYLFLRSSSMQPRRVLRGLPQALRERSRV